MYNSFEQLQEQAENRLTQEINSEKENLSDFEHDKLELYQTELEIQHEELQRAYSEVNQLYEKYWSLYEFAPCGYVTLNRKGRITRINRQGTALLGNVSSPLTNFGFSRFIISHHQSFFFTSLQQAKQTGEKQSLALQLKPLDDQTLLWVHLDIQASFDDHGEVEKYDITLTDVTADKEAEIAREKAERLQLITDSVQGCIAYIDANQRYQFVNKTHQQWLGLTEEELLNKPLVEVLGEERYQLFFPHIEQVLQGKTVKCETQLPYQYRELRDVSVTLVPDFSSTAKVEGYYVLMTDITEFKQLTRQLQEQAERERLVNTITYAVRQSLDLHEVLEQTVTKLQEVFRVDEAVLAVYGKDEKDSSLVRVATEEASYWSTEFCHCAQAKEIFQEEEVVAINDLATKDNLCFRAAKAQSLLLGGIYYNQQLQGVISLQYQNSSYEWSDVDKSLLKQVAHQIAIALQQAKLYEQLNQELTERTQLQNQLHYDAYHDRLTGLPNRYLLIERLDYIIQYCEDSEESDLGFAVLFLDLNGFKYINDTFGHEMGDQLLINVTLRLNKCLRKGDMIARFGGDEFVILLEKLPEKERAIEVANRIQNTLKTPIVLKDIEVQVGTSIGIVYDEGQYTSSDPILRDADIAMYQSKNQGVEYIIFDETDNVS